MKPVFSRTYKVRSYETGADSRLKVTSLFNYFEDIASDHATDLGVGGKKLFALNRTWVLSRLHLQLTATPQWGDDIEVRTWPCGWRKRFALREFRVGDSTGKELGRATSAWLFLDLESKKPLEASALPNEFPLHEERLVDNNLGPIPKLSKVDRESAFNVCMGDIDPNQHVNNAVYLGWALEALPPELLLESSLVEIEIAFRSEAVYGDRVLSQVEIQPSDSTTLILHAIINEKNGRELARMKSRWQHG